MIWFFNIYAFDKRLGKAYNRYMELLPSDNDWACFTDGDCMFLTPDFGHQIQEFIDKENDSRLGLITAVTNRVGNLDQCYEGKISDNPDILHHHRIADKLSKEKRLECIDTTNVLSGMVMIVRKKTWKDAGGFIENGQMLGVDNQFSWRCICAGWRVTIMQGLYVLHYYRMHKNIKDTSHLR